MVPQMNTRPPSPMNPSRPVWTKFPWIIKHRLLISNVTVSVAVMLDIRSPCTRSFTNTPKKRQRVSGGRGGEEGECTCVLFLAMLATFEDMPWGHARMQLSFVYRYWRKACFVTNPCNCITSLYEEFQLRLVVWNIDVIDLRQAVVVGVWQAVYIQALTINVNIMIE